MVYYIYCIWVKTENGVLRYYGHTENMRVRKNKHVERHNRWVAAGRPEKTSEVYATRSVYILDHDDWRMDVVDTIECETKDEARTLEGKWILENDCVNMNVAGRTQQQYEQDHKEETKERHKQYRETHKEERNEYNKQYRKQYVTCEVCGSVVNKGDIARHRRTKKHQNALNSSESNINTIQ
jgi:hypothetical protein